ncbi:polysaccharide deacetylase family protein [Maribacter arenosus]|uniref:Uncharacterized protein n=1 Tax=Maribacter arenosus TaxID=1854708 RepID=A0ABR7VDM6_9FLAO|nr:hypothetical protein [Maribacter arenosus]MBD0851041.1 hypothetical protein [Maribacter arenosus]
MDADKCIFEDDIIFHHLFLGQFAGFERGRLADHYAHVLDDLPTGFNILIIHPAFDDREMRGITVTTRILVRNSGLDYEYSTSESCRGKLKENNIQLVAWHEIKSGMNQ